MLQAELVFDELLRQVFKQFGPKVRPIGWPGPPDQRAGLAWSKYIVVPLSAAIVWALVVRGTYDSIEKVFPTPGAAPR